MKTRKIKSVMIAAVLCFGIANAPLWGGSFKDLGDKLDKKLKEAKDVVKEKVKEGKDKVKEKVKDKVKDKNNDES